MKKTLGVLATVALVGAAAVTAPAPAEARGRGIGPGLAFGLAAGAIAAGAAASSYNYYGPGYGYYGPRRYYGPGPYAYYGDPYYPPAIIDTGNENGPERAPGLFVASGNVAQIERPAESIPRIRQCRVVVLLPLALEFCLHRLEVGDACGDGGALACQPFLLLCHGPSFFS